jgi:hypothetical protein
MANSNVPMGLIPVGTIGSSGYVGRIEKFNVPATDATAIGIGDTVTLVGAGGIATNGLPIVKRGTVGGIAIGVCVGVELVPTDLTLTYRKASTAINILVDTDPMTIYEIQENGAIALANGTKDCSLILGTVDTVTGNSKTMLNSGTVAATATLDCLLLRPSMRVDNTVPGTNAKWLVKLNLHQYSSGAISVGV